MTDGVDRVHSGKETPGADRADRRLRRSHLGDGDGDGNGNGDNVGDLGNGNGNGGAQQGSSQGSMGPATAGARGPMPYPGTSAVGAASTAPSWRNGPSLVGIPQGAVPYLGPIPPPGRFMETYAFGLSVAVAVVLLVHAVAFLPLIASAQRLFDETGGARYTDTNASEFSLAKVLVDLLWLVCIVGSLGTIAVQSVWRSKRRPKDIVRIYGESYVEAPAKVYLSLAHRGASVALVVFTFLGFQAGRLGRVTSASEIPGKFLFTMGASITLALAFGFEAYGVRIARNHTDARLAWSGPYRENPTAVPYVAPVASGGAFEGTSGQNSAGIGWIFTTLGLSMVGIIGGIAFIAGVASLGGKDRVAAAISLVVGAAMLGTVGWRIKVRREKKAQATTIAAANPYGPPQQGEGWPGANGPAGPPGP